jgi:hypothetical protein
VDFSRVRLHPDAPEVTRPLRARAVTFGQDIYFHPGEFEPDSSRGQALIAHEIAHTLQTRGSENPTHRAPNAAVSRPGDALEKNASALARGETSRALAAPAGAALRSPFDSERADERSRRERLLESIGNATETILRLLRTGGLVEDAEVAAERGSVRGVVYSDDPRDPDAIFRSYAQRDARLRRMVRSLMALGRFYRTAPIPADFAAPVLTEEGEYQSTVTYPPGSRVDVSSYGGKTPEWADLQAAYERYRATQGQTDSDFDLDWFYLDPDARIIPGAARGAPRIGRGVPSGAYMVVPDIENEPLRYWRLDGFSPVPEGSVIVEFWHDDFGYYYMHRSGRIDVPSPWSR